MWKPVVVMTAALAIAGTSMVGAQQRFGGPDSDGYGGQHFHQWQRPSVEDMAAFTDARIAALRAGLELTPDQAKNWPAFEQALRDMAQLHIQRRQAHDAAANQPAQPPGSPFDRLAHRADEMGKTSAAYKHIADTGAPLYQSLTNSQKHRFMILARMLKPHHHMPMHARNEGGPGDGHPHWPGYEARRFGESDPGPAPRMQPMMDTEEGNSDL